MSHLEIAKNPYIIALAGQEGAEKLAEVVGKHKKKSYLWSSEYVNKQLTRVSALNSYRDSFRRLDVDGDYHGYGGGGCAFGVSGKALSKNIF